MKNIYTNRSFDDLIGEEWKLVLEFPNYMVSNLGRVKSLPVIEARKKILKQRILHYPFVTLYKNGGASLKKIFVHRLVALAFIPNIGNKPYVNHKNAIKTDNHYSNLEWVTSKENSEHAMKMGLIKGKKGVENYMFGKTGINNIRSKPVLQFDLVGNIIKEYVSVTEAAKATGLLHTNISHVCTGKRNMCGDFIFQHKYNSSATKNVDSIIKRLKEIAVVKVKNVNTGTVYNSIRECARIENINRIIVKNSLKNIHLTSKHNYQYVNN